MEASTREISELALKLLLFARRLLVTRYTFRLFVVV